MKRTTDAKVRLLVLVVAAFVLMACEAVIGENFSGYSGYCDPLTSAGCKDGTRCDLAAKGTPTCLPEGSADVDEMCALSSDCKRGLTCANEPDGSLCRPYCVVESASSLSCTDSSCSGFSQAREFAGKNYGACFRDCDPLHPTQSAAPFVNCKATEGCYLRSGAGAGCFANPGTGDVADDCASPLDCKSGMICFSYGSAGGLCFKLCALGGNDCGTGPFTCQSLAQHPVLNGIEYGACH